MLGVAVRSYFIQYRFILPDNIKHSSYTYQKIFRAIYGYTQDVFKANGKNYKYSRPGVLSKYPYIRPGKNCVIIPTAAFQSLQEFFKTGKNPAHNWVTKGEWKCTYFMNEKDVDEKQITTALEEFILRKFIDVEDKSISLMDEMKRTLQNPESTKEYKSLLIRDAQPIIESEWFKDSVSHSSVLNEFLSTYKALKA